MVGPALSESEYLSRQIAFLSQLPENSLVLIPTNPVAYRSNDTAYPYRANSYMLYPVSYTHLTLPTNREV